MYIPWSWLKKHIIFSEKDKQQTVAKKLTALGLETEIVGESWQFTPSPNRLDLFSWWGVVQEISILLNCPLNLPAINQLNLAYNQKAEWGKIRIDTDGCYQFQLTLIQNVEIYESPAWIKDYLAINNIDSINNIVDIANLVMLETGQPLHAYDYDQLSNREIVVRNALSGETMTNLKKQKMVLSNEDIVISAGKEIISLAGIIGSRETSISSKTTNFLIESAFFDPSSIKKTTQRLGLPTQASQYFSKRHNLPFGNYALTRAIKLIREIYPNVVVKDAVSWVREAKQQEKRNILINHEFIEKKLGAELSSEKVEEILKKLRFSFQTGQLKD